MRLTEQEVVKRCAKYEALVCTTTDYWRRTIPREYDDDDVKQELRITVVRALRRWDPDHPRSISEERHVFGAIRNRVTDLQRTGNRKVVDEVLVDRMPGEELVDGPREGSAGWPSAGGLPKNGSGATVMTDREDFLNGLPSVHQRMSIMIISGYSKTEIMSEIGLTANDYREHLSTIKSHLRGGAPAYAACEIRMMTGWEQLVLMNTDGAK